MTHDRPRALPDVPARALRGQLRHQSVDGSAELGARSARARRGDAANGTALHRTLVELGATIELVPPARGSARSRLHRQCGGRARSPGAAGALPPSRAPARGGAFRGRIPLAPGARPGRCGAQAAGESGARRRRRLRLGRDAQAVLDGLRPAFGRRRASRGRGHVRPARWSRSSSRTSASTTWTPRSARCPAAR